MPSLRALPVVAAALLVVLTAGSTALAQPRRAPRTVPPRAQPAAPDRSPSPGPDATSETTAAPPEQALPPVTLTVCVAEPVYQRAFNLIVLGQYDAAEGLLLRVLRVCPAHPYAPELLRMARAQIGHAEAIEDRDEALGRVPRANAGATPAVPQVPSLTAPESTTALARGELIGASGAVGLVHGATFCVMFVANFSFPPCSIAGVVIPMFVGAALGAGVAAVASWEGVRPGQAMVTEAGMVWGSYDGFLIALAATDGFRSNTGIAAGALFEAGLGVGLLSGVLTAVVARPRAGHIAFMNSGGFWGGITGLFGWVMSLGNCCSSAPGFAASQLVGVNVGLIAGAVAGALYPVSRARMLLVDLGTLLGGGVGAGIGTLVGAAAGGAGLPVAIGGFAIAGMIAGYATTLAITHRIDHPDLPRGVQTAFAPVSPDGHPGVSASLTF